MSHQRAWHRSEGPFRKQSVPLLSQGTLRNGSKNADDHPCSCEFDDRFLGCFWDAKFASR
jgi:hypothetical protein